MHHVVGISSDVDKYNCQPTFRTFLHCFSPQATSHIAAFRQASIPWSDDLDGNLLAWRSQGRLIGSTGEHCKVSMHNATKFSTSSCQGGTNIIKAYIRALPGENRYFVFFNLINHHNQSITNNKQQRIIMSGEKKSGGSSIFVQQQRQCPQSNRRQASLVALAMQ